MDQEHYLLLLPPAAFKTRARNVLQALQITAIGEFLETEWETLICSQFGAGTRAEMLEVRRALGTTPESIRAWHEGFSETPKTSTAEFDEALLNETFPTYDLSVRAQGVMQNCGVVSLGDFIRVDWKNAVLPQLGAKTRNELKKVREELGQTNSSLAEWLENKNAAALAETPFLPAATDLPESAQETCDWIALWPSVLRAVVYDERAFEILARRFGLDGQRILTLDKLGVLYRVERERIRQIEEASLRRLRGFIKKSHIHGFARHLHPRAAAEIEALREWLGFELPLPDEELWATLAERYGRTPSENEKSYFAVFLELCGVEKQRFAAPILADIWIESGANKKNARSRIKRSASVGVEELQKLVMPCALDDLLLASNSALEKERPSGTARAEWLFDRATLRRILRICPGVEEIDDDFYQIRFEKLNSNVARVERIMREWSARGVTVAKMSEIRDEVNRRLNAAGRMEKSSLGVLGAACQTSPHIINIGNSGGWTLRKNAGETRDLHEIMEEALRAFNRPALVAEISEYVEARRVLSKHSVAGLLLQHDKFQRVGRGVYGLREWHLPEIPPTLRSADAQREFDDALVEVFIENGVHPLRLATLAKKIAEITGRTENTIRMALNRSPWVKSETLADGTMIAHWCDDASEVAAEPAKRESKRGRIHEIARRLLENAPSREMAGVTLCALIERETGYVRPQIYNALAHMPGVERGGDARNASYRAR